jgi:hypothetical protein
LMNVLVYVLSKLCCSVSWYCMSCIVSVFFWVWPQFECANKFSWDSPNVKFHGTIQQSLICYIQTWQNNRCSFAFLLLWRHQRRYFS